jgi:hypothetical protein
LSREVVAFSKIHKMQVMFFHIRSLNILWLPFHFPGPGPLIEFLTHNKRHPLPLLPLPPPILSIKSMRESGRVRERNEHTKTGTYAKNRYVV